MQKEYGMYQGYNVEASMNTETSSYESTGSACNMPMNMSMQENVMPGMQCSPIYECPCERVVHREICHHVPQD